MSLPRYPEYKPSGVEWLGEVPGHWDVAPFYSVAKEREEPNKGMVEDNLLSLSYGRIVQKDISSNDGLLPESFETYQIVRQGDIVFRLTDLQNDKRSLRTAIVEETGIITSAYLAAMPFGIAPRYLNHLLRAYDKLKVFYSMGGGLRQSMKFSDVKRLPTLSPTLEEQQTIAAFLDRETGKIDALIAEQRCLVELLAEKRQAVISHAVTKGLPLPRHSGAGRNPAEKLVPRSGQSGCPATQEFSNELDSAPVFTGVTGRNDGVVMKDSGIEWLGEVPKHWEVKRLKFAATVQTGIAKGKDNAGRDTVSVPYLRVANVQDGYLDLEDVATIDIPLESLDRYRLQSGDVLMNEGGDFDKLGRGHVWRCEVDPCIHQNHVFAVRPHSISSDWLNLVTGTNYAQFYFMTRSKQSTNLASISSTNIMELPVVCPPAEEQSAIVAFLDTETAKFDALTLEANRAIALLQERRSALISAAVTGKIDVRRHTGAYVTPCCDTGRYPAEITIPRSGQSHDVPLRGDI